MSAKEDIYTPPTSAQNRAVGDNYNGSPSTQKFAAPPGFHQDHHQSHLPHQSHPLQSQSHQAHYLSHHQSHPQQQQQHLSNPLGHQVSGPEHVLTPASYAYTNQQQYYTSPAPSPGLQQQQYLASPYGPPFSPVAPQTPQQQQHYYMQQSPSYGYHDQAQTPTRAHHPQYTPTRSGSISIAELSLAPLAQQQQPPQHQQQQQPLAQGQLGQPLGQPVGHRPRTQSQTLPPHSSSLGPYRQGYQSLAQPLTQQPSLVQQAPQAQQVPQAQQPHPVQQAPLAQQPSLAPQQLPLSQQPSLAQQLPLSQQPRLVPQPLAQQKHRENPQTQPQDPQAPTPTKPHHSKPSLSLGSSSVMASRPPHFAATVAASSSTVEPSPVKTRFPTARIKRIMQADEEVGKVAQQTPIAVGKALELFMIALVQESANVARAKGQKRVSAQMLKEVVEHGDQWDFLRDIVAKASDVEEKPSRAPRAKAETDSDDDDEPKKKRGGRRKKSTAME